MMVFTRLGGDFSDFLVFLLGFSEQQFARVVLLFIGEFPPKQEKLKQIPLYWEAFCVFEDGRFSRVQEEAVSNAFPLDR